MAFLTFQDLAENESNGNSWLYTAIGEYTRHVVITGRKRSSFIIWLTACLRKMNLAYIQKNIEPTCSYIYLTTWAPSVVRQLISPPDCAVTNLKKKIWKKNQNNGICKMHKIFLTRIARSDIPVWFYAQQWLVKPVKTLITGISSSYGSNLWSMHLISPKVIETKYHT